MDILLLPCWRPCRLVTVSRSHVLISWFQEENLRGSKFDICSWKPCLWCVSTEHARFKLIQISRSFHLHHINNSPLSFSFQFIQQVSVLLITCFHFRQSDTDHTEVKYTDGVPKKTNEKICLRFVFTRDRGKVMKCIWNLQSFLCNRTFAESLFRALLFPVKLLMFDKRNLQNWLTIKMFLAPLQQNVTELGLLASSYPSAYNISRTTKRIFMIFDTGDLHHNLVKILSLDWTAIYRVWIGNWTFPWLQITMTVRVTHSKYHCNHSTHKIFSGFPSRYLVSVSNSGRSPYSGFPKYPRPQLATTNKGMVRSDMSKPAIIFFSLQEHTQQNPLSKF
jgi:hypothetical protein